MLNLGHSCLCSSEKCSECGGEFLFLIKVDQLQESTVGDVAHKPTYFVPGNSNKKPLVSSDRLVFYSRGFYVSKKNNGKAWKKVPNRVLESHMKTDRHLESLI